MKNKYCLIHDKMETTYITQGITFHYINNAATVCEGPFSEFQWREMTKDERDQFEPMGHNTFCEIQGWMEDNWTTVRITIDECCICLEYTLPQTRPDDPDVILALRNHNSWNLNNAILWIEDHLLDIKSRKQLAEMGFHTEII